MTYKMVSYWSRPHPPKLLTMQSVLLCYTPVPPTLLNLSRI